MKKNPNIINTSRGKLIDTDSLIDAIEKNQIKSYLTDVLAQEPIHEEEKLIGVKNIIITPHIGSRTYQSIQRQGSCSINNLINNLI